MTTKGSYLIPKAEGEKFLKEVCFLKQKILTYTSMLEEVVVEDGLPSCIITQVGSNFFERVHLNIKKPNKMLWDRLYYHHC